MEPQTDEQFTIEVNGIEIKIEYEKLVAADILKRAANNGAFSGKWEDYVLESDDPVHEFKNNDWVDFHEYKIFSAEKSGSTPIAAPCENE